MLPFEGYQIPSYMFSYITKPIQSKCGFGFSRMENGWEASVLISVIGAHQDEVFTLTKQ